MRMMTIRVAASVLALALLSCSGATEAQRRTTVQPEAMFQAFDGTWVYVVKLTAAGKPATSVGLVTFTKTGPTAMTFTAASRAYTPSAEHQGYAYSPEFGKLWWDADKGQVARQEGQNVEHVDLIDLGYEWTEQLPNGMPSRGINEALTMKAKMFVDKPTGNLGWTAEASNARGDVLFTGNTVFTRVKE